MARRDPRADALRDASNSMVADPELQARLNRIMGSLLDDVERTIKIGDATDKAKLLNAIIPGLLRSAASNARPDTDAELYEAFDRIMSAVRGDETAFDDDDVDD